MTQKRFKKLMMGLGIRRNVANEAAKNVAERSEQALDGYRSYEEAATDIVNTLALLESPIPITIMTIIQFNGDKPTIGRQIHILRGEFEINRRNYKARKNEQ